MNMNSEQTWHVYLLKCNDSTIYTGCTNNLERRLKQHENREVKSTASKLPFVLITYITFTDKYKAYNFEKYLKSGSGIAFRNKRLV